MPKNYFKSAVYLAVVTLLCACASKTTRYLNTEDKMYNPISLDTLGSTKEYQSVYLYGNAGSNKNGPDKALLQKFQQFTKQHSTKDDYLIFLGDNVYANRLKKDNNKEQLDMLLNVFKTFNGTPLIIPGENDWNDNGVEGLEKLEDYVEEFMGKDENYLPENGCPIETIDVSFNTEIIVIDTQWYIEDWSKQAEFNAKCEIKTREKFIKVLTDEVRKARHKNVLLVMHHPVYSNGIYGGEISNDILFNPKPENLFLPTIGAPWTFMRTQGGLSKQDLLNPLMNELISEVKTIARQAPLMFVLSAHEQSLQYIIQDNLHQIISGTGGKKEGSRLGKNGLYSSGKAGFAELRLYEDRSSRVIFYELDEKENIVKAFDKEAFASPEDYDLSQLPKTYPKTVKTTIYPPEETKVSKRYEEFFGEHYRYLYGKEIEAQVVLLDTLYGGLKVERAGGGNQTQSLRLVDKNDKEYNMRAIAKDAERFLQSSGYNDLDSDVYFEDTIPLEIIEDFYTASHPYGAFAIPKLAGAINLGHTHPKLFYVPKQKTLGEFNEYHGDRLYMIVEKPDSDFNNAHMFGFNKEVESTSDLFEELRKDETNVINEKEYIKARIFDILVGDWDRHEDQWRWALLEDTENTGKNVYLPIPRDRDQVFAKFDGTFIKTLQSIVSSTKQLGLYGPDIEFIDPFSESALNLDRALLQKTSLEDWHEQIELIQKNITPEIVDKAFNDMPVESQDEVTEQIKKDFLARKANLKSIIERYYENIISFQTLLGTDKDDHFIITKLPDGKINIEAYRIKDGKDEDLIFNRAFNDKDTHTIWIYGLGDDDVFEIKGDNTSKIKITIAGGLGEDTYNFSNGKNVIVYDQEHQDNVVKEENGARFRINDVYENHIYDPERRPSSGSVFGLNVAYNPDLGAVTKLLVGKETLKFERNPFTKKFDLLTTYYPLTQAVSFEGSAQFAHLFHDWNLKISSRVTSNNYTENFFGFGNSTDNPFSNYDANRIYTRHFSAGASTYYKGEFGSAFEIGFNYYNVGTEASEVISGTGIGEQEEFAQIHSTYHYLSTNSKGFPNRGMEFKAKGYFSDNLSSSQTTLAVDPSLTFWNAIDSSRDVILKTSASGQLRFGDAIPFYQSARIGGEHSLRSYRLQRFTGQQSLVGNVELQYNFKPLKTVFLPIRSLGYLGYDTGRVWIDDESNSNWHYSYGGGIIFSVSGLTSNLSYFHGEEGGRFAFNISFGI